VPKMTACSLCGGRMELSRNVKAGHAPAHNKCRTDIGMPSLRTHGTSGYRGGCRCDVCRAGQAAKMRAYANKVQAESGVHPTTLQRRRFRDENGYWPQVGGAAWIDPKMRHALYERDGWSCAICELPVDREAHWNDDLAPSLDHIRPRSLGGSHDAENLRTAHRICNSVRGAEHELA